MGKQKNLDVFSLKKKRCSYCVFIQGNRSVQTRQEVKIWDTKKNSIANMVCFLHSFVNCRSMALNCTVLWADTRYLPCFWWHQVLSFLLSNLWKLPL